MNGVESLAACHASPRQENLCHFLPVPPGKSLTDLYIMEIILQVFPRQIAEIFRHAGLRLIDLPMKLL